MSERGFEQLPEKLESIRKMPAPRTAKELKQFFGLIGYYRKFVPRFADISRPLTKLTHHNVVFEWTDQCSKAFNHLHELLMEYPILRYPDPKQGYILYTDASGIGWSGVLTQEHLDVRQWKKPPHLLRKWTVQRKPVQLGSLDQGGICRPCQVRAQGKVKEARLLLTCNPLFIYNGAGTQLLTACTSRIFPE